MFFVTLLWNWSRGIVQGMLAALSARPAGAILTTPTVHLCKVGSGVIGPDTPVSQFVECDFTGYTPQALTLAGTVRQGPNTTELVFGQVTFTAAGGPPFTQNTAVGYYVTDGAGAVYYGGEAFPQATPALFSGPGDFLSLTVVLPVPLKAAA